MHTFFLHAVSVSERVSPSGSMVKGLCSSFLHQLQPGTTHNKCRVFTRDSLFRLPEKIETPIVMIGPGSGIAPMRALLQERELLANRSNIPLSKVTNILYFGCKSRELDFLYQEELLAAVDTGLLTSLELTFSREQKEKVYVQTLLARPENAARLVELVVDQDAHVFVCG